MTAPLGFSRFALLFCLALALAAVPVFSTVLPPLVDYPNHLARMHILAEGGAAPLLDQFYQIHWAPLPNLAMDLIVPTLARIMPLELAGKLFILLVFLAMAGGAAALNRVLHGHWSWWSLAVFAVLYNRILQWGFLNYLFGLGLALGGLALWLGSTAWPVWRRVLAASVVSVAIYFSHVAAFAVYLLLVAGVEAGPGIEKLWQRDWRGLVAQAAVAGAQFLIPAGLILGSWGGSAAGALNYARWVRKFDLLFTLFDSYDRKFEIVCFAAFILVLAALAWRRELGFAKVMRWPLALVTIVYAAMPAQLFGGSGADRRMAIVIFLVILAGSLPRPTRIVAGVFLLLFFARLAVFEARWLESDGIYRADIAALDQVPEGAKIAVARLGSTIEVGKDPELHLATLAILRRSAFVPSFFAFPTQQPVRFTPRYAALAEATDEEGLFYDLVARPARPPAPLLAALKSYDFIAFVDLKPFQVPATPCLEPVAPGTTFQLFAIKRDCADWS